MTTLPTIAELVARGALFVVNHSGGKDSQAMMIAVLRQVPADQVLVVHAALGEVEWNGALELAQKQAADAGVPFIVAKAIWKDGAEKTFLGMVEKRFADRPQSPSWPSGDCRYCTSDLKRDPINREVRRFMKARGLSLVVNCEGLRADESTERAKKSPFEVNARLAGAGREAYTWLPIFSLSMLDVFCTIRGAGQEPHWAYANNERLSCVFCIYGSASDLAHGAQERPELFAKYTALEAKTGYTMHMSRKSLVELVAEAALERSARSAS